MTGNNYNQNKEIFKNSFILGFKGGLSDQDLKKILNSVLITRPSKEQWRELIIYTKEISKEIIDGEIDKIESKNLPTEWKGDVKNFIHAFINYTLTLLNEDFFYDVVEVVNKTGLSNQQELLKQVLPIFIREMDKITVRANLLKPSNYHGNEKSLSKKSKQVIGIVKRSYFNQKIMKNNDEKAFIITEGKKLLKILQSLSLEEIKVMKEKLKFLATEYVDFLLARDTKMSAEEKNLAKSFVTSYLNYGDAVCDEKIIKDYINILAKGFKNIEKKWNEELEGLGFWEVLQKLEIEQDLRNLLISLTNHLNNLSIETGKSNNISSEGEKLIENLGNNLKINNLPQDQDNGNALTNNVVTDFFGKVADPEKTLNFNWTEKLEKTFTTVQSKGKWYQNPWFIGFSIVGAFIIGGLAFWFFTKKKDKVKTNYN